jgi:polysaccharide export outer membrane protein
MALPGTPSRLNNQLVLGTYGNQSLNDMSGVFKSLLTIAALWSHGVHSQARVWQFGRKPVRKRICILLLSSFALAGCSQSWEQAGIAAPPGGTGLMADGSIAEGPTAVSSISQLPSHDAAGAVAPFGAQGTAAAYEYQSGYKVGAGDKLTIRVAGESDLTADYLVDGSGNISLPYIQTVHIAGMTTPQVERLITARLRNGYLRDPKVSVQATALRPFFILGEVTTSGSFAYQSGITVQNAIAIAGGYGARADQGTVLITRKNATGTETHRVPVTTQIYPGDIIYVSERWF